MSILKKYISEGEHQQQDFKHRIDDQKKIARSLAAFANTKGGKLLIGVKDNGKISGINPEEEFHMIQGASDVYCQPNVQFQSTVHQEDLKLVLEIQIEEFPHRFVKCLDEEGQWNYYIRFNDQNIKANRIIILFWKLQLKPIDKPLVFKNSELVTLQKIQENQNSTLSKLFRLIDLPKKEIEHALALLLHWKMINWTFEEGSYKYFTINI